MLITIGAFDGFHKGHAKLLELCRENSVNNEWGVVTFYPHPSEFMHNLNHPMFTHKERELIRKILGIPNIFVLNFDEALKNLSPEKFWELLNEKINIDGLVIGSDFHFGKGRSGNAKYLENLAKSQNIRKILIVNVLNKANFSSSNIREKILAGDVKKASEFLGYNWFIIGSVIHGNERGRTMKFPTANINLNIDKIIPSYGVYSTAVLINNEWYCGALSIGNNPTFHDVKETRAEVHILDFHGDIYGDEILILFLDRLRDIKTFSDKEKLMSQIKIDTEKCRKIFNETRHEKFYELSKKFYTEKNFIPEIIKLC